LCVAQEILIATSRWQPFNEFIYSHVIDWILEGLDASLDALHLDLLACVVLSIAMHSSPFDAAIQQGEGFTIKCTADCQQFL
jgi:hypothetical protein